MRSALIENGQVTNIIKGQLPGYVECPDEVRPGWSYDETNGFHLQQTAEEEKAEFAIQVNEERDRRMFGSVPFDGKLFDYDALSRANITGAAALAKFALIAGAQQGDLRWANPDRDFVWIAKDNSVIPMDAQTMSDFGDTAAGWVQSHVLAARAIKDMDPQPVDIADDALWPAVSAGS